MAEVPSDKSYTIAVALSAVFGVVGIQHFYLGRIIEGSIDLGMFIGAFLLLFADRPVLAILVFALDGLHTFIVTIMLLTGSFRDGKGRLVCYPGQRLSQGEQS